MIPTIGVGASLIGQVSLVAGNSAAALGALTPIEAGVALAALVYGTLGVLVVRNLRNRVETVVPAKPPAAEAPTFKRAA